MIWNENLCPLNMGIPRNSVGWAVETWVVLSLLRQAQRIIWGKEGIDACYFSTTLVKGNKNKNDAVNLMKKDADQASIYSTKEHHPFKCMHAIMQPSGTIKNYRLICDWCVHKQSNLLGYICRYDMKTLSPVVQLLKAFQSPNPWLIRPAMVEIPEVMMRRLSDYHHRISE